MELHQLRYVVAIARTGNFSRAAEQCHVSQPSLSQQVQKLEDELGERLFDRLKRQARLTPAGERFLQRAARILDEVDAAQREALQMRALEHGTLSIGVLPTIAPYVLAPVVTKFRDKFPGVKLVIHEDTTARLMQIVAACEADFAIVSLPIDDTRFATRELFTEELLLALPPHHRLTRQRRITSEDLEAETFILMKEGHCLGDQVLRFCNQRDFQPQISCRSAQIETLQALVLAGAGISFVPKMACRDKAEPDAPIYRSLAAPAPRRAIVAMWMHQRPPGRAAEEFLALF